LQGSWERVSCLSSILTFSADCGNRARPDFLATYYRPPDAFP
jgi:hypothetical protein